MFILLGSTMVEVHVSQPLSVYSMMFYPFYSVYNFCCWILLLCTQNNIEQNGFINASTSFPTEKLIKVLPAIRFNQCSASKIWMNGLLLNCYRKVIRHPASLQNKVGFLCVVCIAEIKHTCATWCNERVRNDSRKSHTSIIRCCIFVENSKFELNKWRVLNLTG